RLGEPVEVAQDGGVLVAGGEGVGVVPAERLGAGLDDLPVGLLGLLQLAAPVQVGGALPGGRVVVDAGRGRRAAPGLGVGPLFARVVVERVDVVDQDRHLLRDAGLLGVGRAVGAGLLGKRLPLRHGLPLRWGRRRCRRRRRRWGGRQLLG